MKDVKDEMKTEINMYRRIDVETIEFLRYMAQDIGVKLFMPDIMELDCREFKKLYDQLYIRYFIKHFGRIQEMI